jgi:hypothetical protein
MINYTTLKKSHNIYIFYDVKIHFTFFFYKKNTIEFGEILGLNSWI